MSNIEIMQGDCRDVLKTLADQSVNCIVTSPPYFGLRDYDVAGQMGLEPTPAEFVEALVGVLREARRVLRDDGTLWLNLGDTYNNNPSTSDIPRSAQGNGTGAFQIPPEKHVQARRAKPNKAQPLIEMGIKKKDLIGIPWRVAFALQADGWYLRQDIIWSKPNPMPESVEDRCTKSHEYVFLLSKSQTYYYDAEAIAEPAVYQPINDPDGKHFESPFHLGKTAEHMQGRASKRRTARTKDELDPDRKRNGEDGSAASFRAIRRTRNKRSVWTVATAPYSEAHFATFPPDLIEPCILAGCPKGGTVLDPFGGSGTTGLVARNNDRNALLIELNPKYVTMARQRVFGSLFAEAAE